jgi:hypothetical protein
VRTKERQGGRPNRTWQRVERLNAVQAADVEDGALAITIGFLDGVAQASELGRLAEHDMLAVLLLKGLVRSYRSRWSG